MIITTCGSSFVDIDGFACIIAYAELLNLLGRDAMPVMTPEPNASVPKKYIEWGIHKRTTPDHTNIESYVVLDLSDPTYFDPIVDVSKVSRVIDHHPGFEEYWKTKLHDAAIIEPIGAAATLVVREFLEHNLLHKISPQSAELLAAAILSNTLIFQVDLTTQEDKDAYRALQKYFNYDPTFEETYFSSVESKIDQDIAQALELDSKKVNIDDSSYVIGQLEIYHTETFVQTHLKLIQDFLDKKEDSNIAFVNFVGLKDGYNHIVCRDTYSFEHLKQYFPEFSDTQDPFILKTPQLMLRKQLLARLYRGL